MSTDDYEADVTAGRAEIAAILHGVAEGVRTGAVRLGDGADAVSVETPEELTLEVELEAEDDGTSLELELEWPHSTDDASVTAVAGAAEGEGAEAVPLAGPTDAPRPLARFEVFQARDAEWRWRLRHRNGNVIATSGEGYTRKHNALKGLRSVMANAAAADVAGEFEP